jgi:hypothetical protein
LMAVLQPRGCKATICLVGSSCQLVVGQCIILSAYFAKRVPEPTMIKLFNKNRLFCAVLFCHLSLMALLFVG